MRLVFASLWKGVVPCVLPSYVWHLATHLRSHALKYLFIVAIENPFQHLLSWPFPVVPPHIFHHLQFSPLLAKANASGDTSALRHVAISDSDEVILDLLNLAAKCIDRSPAERPTMAAIHPHLAHWKTKLYGHAVPVYAEKVTEEVSTGKLDMSMSLEEEMSWFMSGSDMNTTSIVSQGTSSTQQSSTTHHSVGIDSRELP